MRNHFCKRLFSVLLAILMLLSVTPVSVAAESGMPEEVTILDESSQFAAPGTAPNTRFSLTLEVGKATQAQINGVRITAASITGTKGIVSATKAGKITAKKVGKTEVTFQDAQKNKYYCDVLAVGKFTASFTLAVDDSTNVKADGCFCGRL